MLQAKVKQKYSCKRHYNLSKIKVYNYSHHLIAFLLSIASLVFITCLHILFFSHVSCCKGRYNVEKERKKIYIYIYKPLLG